MKAVSFKGQNTVFGKNQPQFNDLPAFIEPEGTEGRSVVYCYELTFEECEEIIQTRRIFGLQQIGDRGFNPVSFYVTNPIIQPEEEIEEAEVIEATPSKEELKELTKVDNIEFEEEIHEELQIGIDEKYNFVLTKKEHALFMRHANMFLIKNNWYEIQDTTNKAFYFQLNQFVKNYEAFSEKDSYEIELDYLNIWTINRFARIAQIEINEENEEQEFFQGIVQKLFDLI